MEFLKGASAARCWSSPTTSRWCAPWPRLEALLARLPQQVSGGELQRIAVATVLMMDPALIFADEPTSRLDPVSQRETMGLPVDSAAERGCALVLVTHDPDLADKVAMRSLAVA